MEPADWMTRHTLYVLANITSIDDVEDYISGFLSSILISPLEAEVKSEDEIIDNLLEKPYLISMGGSDSEIISRFLNELVTSANSETINDFIDTDKS